MARIIRLHDNTLERLEKERVYPRETWDDIVNKVLEKEINETKDKHKI